MDGDTILETRRLRKEFKGFCAVSDFNLRVKRGHIHALIGPNGAGKTTVFNLLTKFLPPTHGRILFNGKDVTHAKPAQIARRGIIRSFQISATFPHLTVLENVRVALQRDLGASFDFWRSDRSLDALNGRALELLETVGLGELADCVAVELPYGRKRALEIATTLAAEPKLMLLDEPTQGMGHEDVQRVTQLIKKVAANRTVLMVEHNMDVVATIADTITVLQRGQIIAEGPYLTVSRDPHVLQAYMGSTEVELRSAHGERRDDAAMTPMTPTTAEAAAGAAAVDTRREPQAGGAPGAELLHIAALHAFYGESHILHGVDLTVNQGELVCLLGRNGAGRTTALKSILGLVGRRSGSIRINGVETIGWAPHKIARLGIGYCPEERGIFASLSCEENLLLPPHVADGGMSIDEIYALFPNLAERRQSPGTRLSGGEQQMLAVARILRTGARLLLLDEISEGLAPAIVQTLARTIGLLRNKGLTIVIAEQNFRFAAPLADRFYVMEHGRIAEAFAATELTSKRDLLHEYLGV